MPSRQLRTLQRILCLTATSHLKRPLCPRGNFAPYSESYASWQRRTSSDFMPSRQLRTLSAHLYALKATSHLTANVMPHGNVALQATFMPLRQRRTSSDFMPLRQLRTLQRILCLMATSHFKRLLRLRGNVAPQATFMPSRQPRTSSAHLYAFKATSHLTANTMPHSNVVPHATFMPSRQLGTSSDLYALEATWHFKRPFCLRGNFAPYNQSYTSWQCLALLRSPCLMTTL